MCLFPRENKNINSKSYQYGVIQFDCGVCPECLSKKARYWALRCAMQAKVSQGMMLTLTYDTYKYDEHGHIIGENEPIRDLHVSKAHAQRFIKRLRYYFPDNDIKYLLTAEYGKRTHRAHYHALIFGLTFDDLRYYKKSKRGNIIYKSPTLEKIWKADKEHNGGICTVDCTNISSAVARYCTKYCAKDVGVDDTFMLFSQGIGEEVLREKFNGKNYYIDGMEYPVPKTVWHWYICKKYGLSADYTRYYNSPWKYDKNGLIKKTWKQPKNHRESLIRYENYFKFARLREQFQKVRDLDEVYQNYISYWKKKAVLNEKYQKSPFDRICALDSSKYWSYKQKALSSWNIEKAGYTYIPPRYKNLVFARDRYIEKGMTDKCGYTLAEKADLARKLREQGKMKKYRVHLPKTPCHNTASDRKKAKIRYFNKRLIIVYPERPFKIGELNPFLEKKYIKNQKKFVKTIDKLFCSMIK